VRELPLLSRISGSAGLEARGAFTLEARAAKHAPGLGGRVHDPDTLPSYRLTARSRPWDFPSPRARTPPGAIPTRLSRAVGTPERLPLRRSFEARAPLSHSLGTTSRVNRVEQCFLRARSRVSEVRLVASTGVATGDASDRCLHSETVSTRALVLRRFLARRSSPCDAFRHHPRTALFPGPFGSVLVRENVSFFAPPRPSEDERCVHREARGRPMRTRPGRIAFHDAVPTSATGGLSSRKRFSSASGEPTPLASDVPVASSVPRARPRISSRTMRWSGGRQDRFRGGLVKGVRFADPGHLPPVDASHAAPAPKHERDRETPLEGAALT